jgi:hypothetical protein
VSFFSSVAVTNDAALVICPRGSTNAQVGGFLRYSRVAACLGQSAGKTATVDT